jgi:hypothetical protein
LRSRCTWSEILGDNCSRSGDDRGGRGGEVVEPDASEPTFEPPTSWTTHKMCSTVCRRQTDGAIKAESPRMYTLHLNYPWSYHSAICAALHGDPGRGWEREDKRSSLYELVRFRIEVL